MISITFNEIKPAFEQDSCTICINKYLDTDYITELSCKHIFHKYCMENLIKHTLKTRTVSCPNCSASQACQGKKDASLSESREIMDILSEIEDLNGNGIFHELHENFRQFEVNVENLRENLRELRELRENLRESAENFHELHEATRNRSYLIRNVCILVAYVAARMFAIFLWHLTY